MVHHVVHLVPMARLNHVHVGMIVHQEVPYLVHGATQVIMLVAVFLLTIRIQQMKIEPYL